jgi:hypothetical protein
MHRRALENPAACLAYVETARANLARRFERLEQLQRLVASALDGWTDTPVVVQRLDASEV